MSELDEIRKRRMAELQQQQAAMNADPQQLAQQQLLEQQAAQQQAEMQAQLKQAMKQILTPEARGRLDNLRLTKPELVQNIEIQLLQSAQAGSLRGKVTDEQLKVLLKNLMGQNGKDSSLMGIILDQLGFDVELVTANFGVYDSFHPAQKSAESIGLKHKVLNLDISILEKAVDMIMEDGFPNDGIKYLHEAVVEEVANHYELVADGTRRDDKTPKLNRNQIRSLEDRKDIQYMNLDSFGYKTIKYLVNNLFELKHEKSNKDTSSDYEVEIRLLIDKKGGNSSDIFPEHYQTNVSGLKKQINRI